MSIQSPEDLLLDVLTAVNRSEVLVTVEDKTVFLSTRSGLKVNLTNHLKYVHHGSSSVLPYILNP